MSNSYEVLKKVGRDKFEFIEEYADDRINSLRVQYDSAGNMEQVNKIQGAVHELNSLKSALKTLKEK